MSNTHKNLVLDRPLNKYSVASLDGHVIASHPGLPRCSRRRRARRLIRTDVKQTQEAVRSARTLNQPSVTRVTRMNPLEMQRLHVETSPNNRDRREINQRRQVSTDTASSRAVALHSAVEAGRHDGGKCEPKRIPQLEKNYQKAGEELDFQPSDFRARRISYICLFTGTWCNIVPEYKGSITHSRRSRQSSSTDACECWNTEYCNNNTWRAENQRELRFTLSCSDMTMTYVTSYKTIYNEASPPRPGGSTHARHGQGCKKIGAVNATGRTG